MALKPTDKHILSSHSQGNKPILQTLLCHGSLEPWSDDPQASVRPAKVNRRSEAHILEREASIFGRLVTAFRKFCAFHISCE